MKKLLENSANQLFRYRGQIPILLVFFAILVIYLNHSITFFEELFGKNITLIMSLLFIFSGHLMRFFVIGFRGRHTSGQNRHEQVAEVLNTTGLYSLVRHPLYFGNFLLWIGVFIWLGDLWFLLFGCIFFFILYIPIMKLENTYLNQKFGTKYTEWAKETPFFIPKFQKIKKPENRFSIKLVWKNEYPGIVSTLSSIWLISFLRLIFSNGNSIISTPLLVFAIFILVFGLTSRFLKYKTEFFPKFG